MQKLQLSIPTPCHENWDKMTPEGQGRFCGSCAKQVIDFSAMTDNQLMQYFASLKNENVCGRVYPDQLNRTFEMPAPANKKIWMYWQYVLAALLFFFTKTQQAKAQTGLPKTELQPLKPAVANADTRIMLGAIRKIPPSAAEKNTITVQDEAGEAIPFVTAIILPVGSVLPASEGGEINISKYKNQESITISAVGYQHKTSALKDLSEGIIQLARQVLPLEEVTVQGYGATTGIMVMAGGISYTRVKKTARLIDTLQNFISFSDNGIKIFPNPVKQGNTINLAVNFKKTGTYQLFFSDAAGRLLLQQNMVATSKQEQQQVTIPVSWTSGMYFVKVIDERNKLVGTEKFVVE